VKILRLHPEELILPVAHAGAARARQVAVGQIENRSCTACRMGLTANVIDSINDLVEDELGVCPECQAFIVR
jgi:predicted  nucleic acid-binding Zn-ribbon protein